MWHKSTKGIKQYQDIITPHLTSEIQLQFPFQDFEKAVLEWTMSIKKIEESKIFCTSHPCFSFGGKLNI